jgi:plasmid stability protein
MATLTNSNLDDSTKAQLRLQAARHGRSMEEEARARPCLVRRRNPPWREWATVSRPV